MKRDQNIVHLSRDHHFGLLFCWKIRQGLKMQIEMTRIASYVDYYWQTHLQKHFSEEENILFTLPDDALCERAVKEHREMESLIQEITKTGGGVSKLQSLVNLLETHIRYEERELFPYLEQKLPANQLAEIGAALNLLHETTQPDEYGDEFWKNIYP